MKPETTEDFNPLKASALTAIEDIPRDKTTQNKL